MRVAGAAVCSDSSCKVALRDARNKPAQAAGVLQLVSMSIPRRTDCRGDQSLELVSPPLHISVHDGVCGRC
jgi:hypothetical protein